jgi:DNA repair protein RecN (Recombination protein N)
VIERIAIRDFAVARSVVIEPGPSLNVFTGETGAGKSLVVDALAFAFGARRGREVIATGADQAAVAVTVSGVDGTTTIERTIGLAGRSTARIDGQPASLSDLAALGASLADIHAQADQLSILRPSVQLSLLDEYGGLRDRAREVAAAVRELREVRRRIAALATDARERERLIEQLTFEAGEIEEAGFAPGEDDALRAEHSRLANARKLLEESSAAIEALEEAPLGEAVAAVNDLAARDPSASELADLAILLESTASELSRALRRYREGIEEDPAALARTVERLDLLARLRRKYGDTIEAILAYAQDARERLATLSGAEESLESLHAREADLAARLSHLGVGLSRARRETAARLVAALSAELESLGMPGAALAVGFAAEDAPDGVAVALPDYEVVGADGPATAAFDAVPRAYTESGFDRVEFLASFNPGESPRPLSAVASGGETSRFLLALATVLGEAAGPRLIVFDEVDEGVGGRAGALIGAALSRLARRHQVFCITHLPQVAAFANRHFLVTKASDSARAWSEVEVIEGEARVEELASMLGGQSEANRALARELLAARERAGPAARRG